MNSFILWGLSVTNPVPIWLKIFSPHISCQSCIHHSCAFPCSCNFCSSFLDFCSYSYFSCSFCSYSCCGSCLCSFDHGHVSLDKTLDDPWFDCQGQWLLTCVLGMELDEATDVCFGKYFSKGPSGMLRKALF